RTGRIDAARTAMERSGSLVKQGVALIRSYEFQTQYLYTDLDAIKPEMIAEATRDARAAAERFAEDSESRVGGIRNAQQGYFSIEDRDPFSPEFKTIRVVTTVQFFLVDD
ncbi:MAG TPA: SIMPL domain-containing protein, partial [Thermoanaerobaculales bacterium]|nr:SIMPL domain-containing protein [Thermoanaerobaculales bacterium]